MTAKSIAIKRRDGRSGGCVGKAVKLTSGDLHCCPEVGTEEVARHPERRAEVSRGRSRKEAGEAIEALRSRKVEKQLGRAVTSQTEGLNGAREGLKGKASKTSFSWTTSGRKPR
jgi:hypothetical protein